MLYRYKVINKLGKIYTGTLQSDSCYNAIQNVERIHKYCTVIDCTVFVRCK